LLDAPKFDPALPNRFIARQLLPGHQVVGARFEMEPKLVVHLAFELTTLEQSLNQRLKTGPWHGRHLATPTP
jgi:hypothetical protein